MSDNDCLSYPCGGIEMKLICILLALMTFQSPFFFSEGFENIGMSQEKISSGIIENKEWEAKSLQGVPFWIALNLNSDNPYVGRNVFLFAEENICTKENLYQVMSELAKEYDSPKYLNIYLYSDKETLQRTIKRYQVPSGCFIFDSNIKDNKIAKLLYGDLNDLPNDVAYAHYFRSSQADEEWFDYIPNLRDGKWQRMIIKAKSARTYTGDLQSDLIFAVESGDVEKLITLIDRGAKIDEVNAYGETALFYAVRYKHLNTVNTLIEKGADIEHKNKYGQTALIEAINSDNIQVVQKLIDAHADVNTNFGIGISALMLAAYKNNAKLVEVLLSNGADVNATDNKGVTALMRAVGNRNHLIVEFLLNKGAAVKVRNNRGETALMLARKVTDNNKVMELLLTAGAKE
jgi:hypothetical protein